MQNDVNFIKNLQMDEMPDGFGSYHNTVEIDSIVAKMEAGSNIIASLKGAMGSSI